MVHKIDFCRHPYQQGGKDDQASSDALGISDGKEKNGQGSRESKTADQPAKESTRSFQETGPR